MDPHGAVKTRELLGAVAVGVDGQAAVRQRHHGHEAEEGELAASAHHSENLHHLQAVEVDGGVLQQQVVHDDRHNTARGAGDEAGNTDADDLTDDAAIGDEIGPLQNDCTVLAEEVPDTHDGGENVTTHGSEGSAADGITSQTNKNGIHDDVHDTTEKHTQRRELRVALATNRIVVTHGQASEDHTEHQRSQVLTSERHCAVRLTRTGNTKQRLNKPINDGGIANTHSKTQEVHITNHSSRLLQITLSQVLSVQSVRTNTNKQTDRNVEQLVHRHGQRAGGEREGLLLLVVTSHVTNIDGIDKHVKCLHHLSDEIGPSQRPDGLSEGALTKESSLLSGLGIFVIHRRFRIHNVHERHRRLRNTRARNNDSFLGSKTNNRLASVNHFFLCVSTLGKRGNRKQNYLFSPLLHYVLL